MRYLPKHRIEILYTEGGEFIKNSDNSPYVGEYVITSNDEYYAGNDIYNLGEKLLKKEATSDRFGSSSSTKQYITLKNQVYKKLLNKDSIPGSKNIPTEKDYEKGYYKRPFLIRVNSKSYKEINKKTAQDLISQNKLDNNLYSIDNITWALTGNVHEINTKNLVLLERKYPGIMNLFPKLNEFIKTDVPVKENLHTVGNYLYYIDGKEYIGFYHVHPEKGPMVGATHTPQPHAKLYYSNEITNSEFLDIEGEAFEQYQESLRPPSTAQSNLNNLLQKSPTRDAARDPSPDTGGTGSPRPSTSTPTAPSAPSAPSYGGGMSSGGGGY